MITHMNNLISMEPAVLFNMHFAGFWVDGQGNPMTPGCSIKISADGKTLDCVSSNDENTVIVHDVSPNPALLGRIGDSLSVKKTVIGILSSGQNPDKMWPVSS